LLARQDVVGSGRLRDGMADVILRGDDSRLICRLIGLPGTRRDDPRG